MIAYRNGLEMNITPSAWAAMSSERKKKENWTLAENDETASDAIEFIHKSEKVIEKKSVKPAEKVESEFAKISDTDLLKQLKEVSVKVESIDLDNSIEKLSLPVYEKLLSDLVAEKELRGLKDEPAPENKPVIDEKDIEYYRQLCREKGIKFKMTNNIKTLKELLNVS